MFGGLFYLPRALWESSVFSSAFPSIEKWNTWFYKYRANWESFFSLQWQLQVLPGGGRGSDRLTLVIKWLSLSYLITFSVLNVTKPKIRQESFVILELVSFKGCKWIWVTPTKCFFGTFYEFISKCPWRRPSLLYGSTPREVQWKLDPPRDPLPLFENMLQ